MTKIFERNLQGKPGLHAFIAGVSTYEHLPGGGPEKATLGDLKLAQLDGTARTAHAIYEWLKKADDDGRLPLPLASVRLLLSPSAGEANLNGIADACTWDKFTKDLNAWRKDARHAKSITFFYFAGHGLARWKGDSVLLMEDFAKPEVPGGVYGRAVDTKHIVEGMAPPVNAAFTIARNQLYFVDACRTSVSTLNKYKTKEAPEPWFNPIEASGVDDRSCPILYGSVPGDTAKLLPGNKTLFSEALLDCLDRLAATGPDKDHKQWHVTTRTLVDAMESAIAAVNKKYVHLGADQSYMPDGQNKTFTIVNLTAPPEVDVEVTVDPEVAVPVVGIDIRDKQLQPVRFIQPGQLAYPYHDRLKAGLYKFSATLLQAHDAYQPYESLECVALPDFPWTAKVTV